MRIDGFGDSQEEENGQLQYVKLSKVKCHKEREAVHKESLKKKQMKTTKERCR
jgi:hypothetical protein